MRFSFRVRDPPSDRNRLMGHFEKIAEQPLADGGHDGLRVELEALGGVAAVAECP